MTGLHSRGSALSNVNSKSFTLRRICLRCHPTTTMQRMWGALCSAASRLTLDNWHLTDCTSATSGRWMEDGDYDRWRAASTIVALLLVGIIGTILSNTHDVGKDTLSCGKTFSRGKVTLSRGKAKFTHTLNSVRSTQQSWDRCPAKKLTHVRVC